MAIEQEDTEYSHPERKPSAPQECPGQGQVVAMPVEPVDLARTAARLQSRGDRRGQVGSRGSIAFLRFPVPGSADTHKNLGLVYS